jgi:peptidoglycan/xylan/chitin deacetylase (PgdA/CDA1 family)
VAYLPVLTYHRVIPEKPTKETDPNRIAVSADQFRAQLRWLRRFGFRTLALDRYVELLYAGAPVPGRHFAITFDDGYRDNLTLALPILQEFGFTATIFMVADEIGGLNRWDDGREALLTAEELRQLRRAGITIGAHTCRHVHLPKVPRDEAQKEIGNSKRQIEDALQEPIFLFAYPYGESDRETEQMVAAAGFRAAFSTDRAPADHQTDFYRLRRAVVFPGNSVGQILWKAQRWYPAYQDWKRRKERVPSG